jgi:hypothetical protein
VLPNLLRHLSAESGRRNIFLNFRSKTLSVSDRLSLDNADEEMMLKRRYDLDIIREVLKVTKEVPIERAYDFSFARKR